MNTRKGNRATHQTHKTTTPNGNKTTHPSHQTNGMTSMTNQHEHQHHPNPTHHPTRTIAYRDCLLSHAVEYFHAPQNCNKSPYMQSHYTCSNTPQRSDNPSGLQATHYRLTTSTKGDSREGVEAGGECPVCERGEGERWWWEVGRGFLRGGGGDREREGGERDGERDREGGDRGDDGGGQSKGIVQIAEEVRLRLWTEMPFAEIWAMDEDGEWVDRRPYRFMLEGVPVSGRGLQWPCGEYKGFNHGSVR